jgi:ABC-2 type transport system ATP-binding protein
MKMLVGLVRPDSGDALIGGHNIQKEPIAAKRIIGFIPDEPLLYERLTGIEFLRFVGGLYELEEKATEEMARAWLERFGLLGDADRLIDGYSHGMRQRLVMCACFLHSPRAVIVDEPMIGLDPIYVRLVRQVFEEKAAEGCAVLISTHTLAIAEQLCHRIGLIYRGMLMAEGTTQEVVSQTNAHDLEEAFLQLVAASK